VDTNEQIAGRVVSLRKRAGLSQADLADRAGVSKYSMSRIESGERKLSATDVGALADVLCVTANEILGRVDVNSRVLLAHRLPQLPHPDDVTTTVRRMSEMLHTEQTLRGLLLLAPAPVVWEMSVPFVTDPQQAGSQLAERVRNKLGRGVEPIEHIEDVLSECGVAAMREPLPARVPGMLAQRGTGLDRVCLTVINSSDFYGRQRFNAAHALGHALCRDASELTVEGSHQSSPDEETRADAFAAHLLAPLEGLRASATASSRLAAVLPDAARIPEGPDALIAADLAIEYRTSTSMMLHQMVAAGLVDEARRVALREIDPDTLNADAGHGHVWQVWRDEFENVVAPPKDLLQNALAAYAQGLLGIHVLAGLYATEDEERLAADLAGLGWAPVDLDEVDPLPV